MPNLTQTDLDTLKSFSDAGDTVGYYNYLIGKGDTYAVQALGVVLGNTSNGAAARDAVFVNMLEMRA